MRVVIVAQHPLWRDALAAIMRDDLAATEIHLASTPEEAVGAYDMLLVDPPSPEVFDAWLRASAAVDAPLKVLVVPERNLTFARAAHALGYKGLLPKVSERPMMAAILKLISLGGEYFPCFDEAVLNEGQGDSAAAERLSKRQRQVWDEMQKGRTNKEIAKALGISVATVKLHVQAILSAAGARNRTEAVSRLSAIRTP